MLPCEERNTERGSYSGRLRNGAPAGLKDMKIARSSAGNLVAADSPDQLRDLFTLQSTEAAGRGGSKHAHRAQREQRNRCGTAVVHDVHHVHVLRKRTKGQ